jgi:PAS domain S-box-containing protein
MIMWNRQLSRRIQKATRDIRIKQKALEKSQEKLQESEAFFRSFAEHTEDCIMRFDRRFRHLYVNQVAELTTGIKKADFIGKTHQELGFPTELINLWHSVLEEVFSTGEPRKAEFRLPNGIWMDWLLFPEKDAFGLVKSVMTSARDITDRKQAEQEVTRLGQFLEGVIENANIWMTVLDADFKVIIWNRAAELISGFDRKEVVGGSDIWGKLFHSRSVRSFALAKAKDTLHEGLSFEDIETSIHTQKGEIRVVAWNLRPLKNENGLVSGLIVLGRDITENAELEKRLRQSQKMEAVGTLASGVAHDFNNLLQAMTSYVQLLLLKCENRPEEHQYLKEIAGSVDRAADLVNQLLAFGRKVASRPRLLDLNQQVEKITRLLKRTIPKMVRIETKPAPDLRLVNADSTQIEQVLVNLANNAKDAMPEGGRLTITTENIDYSGRENRDLEGLPKGRYVRLSVSDTGSGMDKETVSHIFEPFYTTKDVGKGTGLGLSMAYGIIKSHNGVLACQSEPYKGSVFLIYLPAAKVGAVIDDEPKIPTKSIKGNRETILLVDDETAIRKAAREFLEMNNYQVLTAENGEQGLKVFQEHSQNIDLVVLDLGMPGMGGAKAMSLILAEDPKARILIASGYSQQKQVQESLSHGAGGFIAKPYRLLELMKKISQMLNA